MPKMIHRTHSQTGIRSEGAPGFTLTMEIISTIIREIEHDQSARKARTIGQHIDQMIADILSSGDQPRSVTIDLSDMADVLIPEHRGLESLDPHGDHFANAESI